MAAFAILVYHFGRVLWPFDQPFLSEISGQLNMGVSYFFCLSGFVMVIAYQDSKMDGRARARYFRNRFARIYPVYVFALLLLVGFYLFFGGKIKPAAFLLGLFAFQAWVPEYALSLNVPGWSICVEFFFYALFPLLVFWYRKTSLIRVLWPAAIFWLLSQVIFLGLLNSEYNHGLDSAFHKAIFYNPLMHLNEFIIGNVGALFFIQNRNFTIRSAGAWAVLALLLIIVLIACKPSFLSYHNGLLAPLFAIFILMLALDKGILSRKLSHPWLVYAGEISYSLYILQLPVHRVWSIILEKLNVTDPYLQFYSYATLLTILSALSYEMLESRAKAWILRISERFHQKAVK